MSTATGSSPTSRCCPRSNYANAKADKDGKLGARYEVNHQWGDGGHSDQHGGVLLPEILQVDLDATIDLIGAVGEGFVIIQLAATFVSRETE